jgi:lysophospholipase L1-like esterase
MSLTAKVLLTPLLVAQALRTRTRMPRLPEAEGDRHGVVGEGPVLKLLIAGDSSAAGVGVVHQRDALAAPLAAELAVRCRAQVHWRLVARSGLNSAQTLQLLQRENQEGALGHFDLALIATGVNDVVDQVPSHRAVAMRESLANWLRNALGVAHVVFMPLPPVRRFPGLPQPLRWVAGTDAERHDRALARWAATRGDFSRLEVELPLDPTGMASDGFHPGAPVYGACARAAAEHVVRDLAPALWPHLIRPETADVTRRSEPEGPDPVHHRRQPRHRAGDRQAGGGRRRQHRVGGQDHRAEPEAARHAVQRR